MKAKTRLLLLMAALAAILAILLEPLPQLPEDNRREHTPETASAGRAVLPEKPGGQPRSVRTAAILAPQSWPTGDRNAESHVPRDLQSWQQDLRQNLLGKIAVQSSRDVPAAVLPDPAVSANAHSGRQGENRLRRLPGDAAKQSEDPVKECPFLLWRELQLTADNTLVINMLLVNNRMQNQCNGVIVSQFLPDGWSLVSAWPEIQAGNPVSREIKWLFADAASRPDWLLQLVMIPEKSAEMPLLPKEKTALRCFLPDGRLQQQPCSPLP